MAPADGQQCSRVRARRNGNGLYNSSAAHSVGRSTPHSDWRIGVVLTGSIFAMPFVAVSGRRSDGKLYVDGGYVYRSDTVKNGTRYLKCDDSYCGGTGVIRDGATEVSVNKQHNHPPSKEDEELVLFRDSIRKGAADISSCTGFRNVYDSLSARYPEGAVLRGFPQDEQIMRRSRNNSIPPVPRDLDDLHDILNLQPVWRSYAFAHNSPHEFFRETVLADDGCRVSVLVSPYFSDLLCHEGVELAADGTFDSRPQSPKTEQLLTIHASEAIDGKRYSWPCAYILMERKTEASYIAAWNAVNNAVETPMRPSNLMGDYERALHTSARKVFPGMTSSGCWFHYSNAVYANAVLLGVADKSLEDTVADHCLLECMALPLLPPGEISNGLQHIEDKAEENGLQNDFKDFFQYINNQWLDENKVGADMLSVFELDSRTNNAVETSHFQIFRKINICHPNFWIFYNALQRYDYAQYQDRCRAKRNVQVRRNRKQSYVKQDENIKEMQMQLVNGTTTIEDFLARACHSVEGLQKRLKAHYRNVRRRRDVD